MGSFSFGEVFTILLVVLIIFGPKRLPELARRIGQLLAKARSAVQDFTATVQQEYGEEASTISGVVSEVDGIRRDIGSAFGAVGGSSTRPSSDDRPLAGRSPNRPDDAVADDGPADAAITDVTAFDDEWPTSKPPGGAGE